MSKINLNENFEIISKVLSVIFVISLVANEMSNSRGTTATLTALSRVETVE